MRMRGVTQMKAMALMRIQLPIAIIRPKNVLMI